MAEEDGKKDEFEFSPSGESLDYISIDQARVLAIQHAQENTDFYGSELASSRLVWEVISQEETDDFYDIQLSFRPGGRFRGSPGFEHFTIDKIGVVQVRQVVSEPLRQTPRKLPYPLAGGVVGIVALVAAAWAFDLPPVFDDVDDPTQTPVNTPPPVKPTVSSRRAVILPPTRTTTPTPPRITPPPTLEVVPPENSIVLAYDDWAGSYLPMYVLKLVFEDELGYQVQISDQKSIPGAFESVAKGQTDIFTSAWFPLREFTLEKYPKLVKLGELYGGKERDAFEGLMLSVAQSEKYGISNVEDLSHPGLIKALDADDDGTGNLIGCPPDWVCAGRLPEILADHGLAEFYEIEEQASEDQMLAAIADRVGEDQPALFYMYQPVAFPGDLPVMDRAVWLKGTEAYLPSAVNRTVVRGDFLANRPGAATILERYRIPGADISRAMARIDAAQDKGASPEFLTQLAQDWINDNRGLVDSWTEGVSRGPGSHPRDAVPDSITIAYSPDKENLFLELVTAYNASRPPDAIPVHPVKVDPSQMVKEAAEGRFEAISPDSSIWLAELEREWQQEEPGAPMLTGDTAEFALSPIVIAMRESVATTMGYPGKPIGWQELADQVNNDPAFTWTHPPASTAIGLLTTTAEIHAGAGKPDNLTSEDVRSAGVLDYLNNVEVTVQRYGGESEDRVITRMLAQGEIPLDAFVAQEQSVIRFNENSDDRSLVAVDPPGGTFWMDHPLVLLDGPWVTPPQEQAFQAFADFLSQEAQQQTVVRWGFRLPDSALGSERGPSTVLPVPSTGLLDEIRTLWRESKKPANLYLVVDVSGSMTGQKLDGVKEALASFIDQVEGGRDQVGLITFSDEVNELEALRHPLDKNSLKSEIRDLHASGSTELYDAVAFAIDKLEQAAGQDRINAIIAMTDGKTQGDVAVLESEIRRANIPVLLFTVGYGADADNAVLGRIARLGNGHAYEADPGTIDRLYRLLSSFF